MKICFISPASYPVLNPNIKSVFGGAEVQMAYLAKSLSQDKNNEIHLMVSDYGQPKKLISACA